MARSRNETVSVQVARRWFESRARVRLRQRRAPPHIYAAADDMGWNETKQMPFVTAVRGMLGTLSLARQYVLWSCAPTRSSLLTGRHAGRWGAGGLGPKPWVDVGVPLREGMLQQMLQGLGYVTAHIGKWHLGHSHRDYIPSNRGFSHSFGHLNTHTAGVDERASMTPGTRKIIRGTHP